MDDPRLNGGSGVAVEGPGPDMVYGADCRGERRSSGDMSIAREGERVGILRGGMTGGLARTVGSGAGVCECVRRLDRESYDGLSCLGSPCAASCASPSGNLRFRVGVDGECFDSSADAELRGGGGTEPADIPDGWLVHLLAQGGGGGM